MARRTAAGRAALACLAAAWLAAWLAASPAAAQAGHAAHHADSAAATSLGAMAIAVASRAWPMAGGETITEGYLTQPMVSGAVRAWRGRLLGYATLNLEGATLRRGEIAPGAYGESYVDRRHPHTWAHEVMLGTEGGMAGARWSVVAGRGFVPFGTDDPMVRPFEKYPANHHHAQVMERIVAIAAVRVGPVSLEAGRFNGDEPEHPADWPNDGRLFDSWSARATLFAMPALEASASMARVASPEFAAGGGLDQRKSSVAVRLARRGGVLRYALVEVARTTEWAGRLRAFDFRSVLAEGEVAAGDASLAVRLERTDRPEEARAESPYRTVRPLLDFGILGRTRWEIVSVHAAPRTFSFGALRLRPFVEGAYHHPTPLVTPTPIEPVSLYGSDRLWMASFGVRMHAGRLRARMGRYGAGA